jgi:S-sulfo-L-cysteine synthase (3-phospho-L-serine-dependent)
MRRPALIFVESNTTGTGRLFVQEARETGFRPVLLTARPERYAYLSQAGAPEVIVVAAFDVDALYRLLHDRFAAGREVAGITSSSEYFVATAAALAARFGLPGPDPTRVAAARNKACQREVLSAGGLPAPFFRVVSSPSQAVRAAREVDAPVVVKPLTGSGSVGVRVCAGPAEAGRHAALLLANFPERQERSVLVESFIDGPEFSVEMFSGHVVGITRKHLGDAPCFVETGHDYPARPPQDLARTLTDVVTRATSLLGLGWGPLHWEVRIRDGRAFIVEVNPRLAGGFIPVLVWHAHGVDLIRATVRLVAGERPVLTPCRHRTASIRFLLAPRPGRFAAATGIDDARAVGGVVDVALYRAIGEKLCLHGDFRDRVGHVMACADLIDAASSSSERARDSIRIHVEGAEGRRVPAAVPRSPAAEARS